MLDSYRHFLRVQCGNPSRLPRSGEPLQASNTLLVDFLEETVGFEPTERDDVRPIRRRVP